MATVYIEKFPAFHSVCSLNDKGWLGNTLYPSVPWSASTIIATHISPLDYYNLRELVLYPETALVRMLSKNVKQLNLYVDINKVFCKLKRPSNVVSRTGIRVINGWNKQLSYWQIVLFSKIIRNFELQFYNYGTEADYDVLYSEKLPEQIRKARVD